MPPVVPFTIAYIAGLAAGFVLSVPLRLVGAVLGVGFALAAAGGLAGFGRARPWAACGPPRPPVAAWWWGVLAAAALAGSLVGSGNARLHGAECGEAWPKGRIAAAVDWHDAPSARETATATVRQTRAGCRGVVRLRVAASLVPPGLAGARVVVVGIHRGHGVVRVERLHVLDRGRDRRYVLRDAVARRIDELYGPRAPLVEALVLGRKDGIPPDLRATFVGSGLAHLLAISGLHVGIMAAWVALVLRVLRVGRSASAATAMVVWGYVALLGFPAAATRAAGFVTVYALARWRQRHPPLVAVLAVAALVVVTIDPQAVTGIGTWLSVAAVWGVARGVRIVPHRWRRQPVARLGAASLGATAVTAPITAYAFGQAAPVGLVANFAAVPLAGVAVPGVFASLAFGELLAGGAGLALAGIEATAALGSGLPGAQVIGEPGLRFALPWTFVLVAFVWLTRVSPEGRLIVLRRPLIALRRLLLAVAIVVWGGVLARDLFRRPSGLLELYVLDVGQGDAIAMRTPHGRWMLVDGGPPHSSPVPALRRFGARRLVALVLSHGDADHLGGAVPAIAALDPALVLEPGQPLPSDLYQEFLRLVDDRGVPWQPARAGDTLVVDGVSLAVLHPTSQWMATEFSANENSVVLHVRYGCFDALLTGDVGLPVERRLASLVGAMDVLKVGHHGSSGSSSAPFLDVVRAPVAVISVGRGNRYGHPAPGVLERLGERGSRVYRTDRGGTVTLRTNGRYLEVEQGSVTSLAERLRCRIRRLLRSSASFSSRSACIPVPPVSLPVCSTTSPSPAR